MQLSARRRRYEPGSVVMLKVGIIGAGGVVQRAHVLAYEKRRDVEVVCIADPVETYRLAVGKTLGCDGLREDYRCVLDCPDVQAVDVCLPHYLHEEVVLAAFDAGKDVLLEKPISLNLDQADRMISTAKIAGRKFYVALNQRFYPAHRKLKEIIDSGKYGRPFLALAQLIGDEFQRMNIKDHWKGTWNLAGGGALADTGTHIVDLMLWWFGKPKAVSCQWGRFVVEAENKADDNVVVTLGYDNMLADISVSYSARSDQWREDKQVCFETASLHLSMDPEKPMLIGRGKKPLAQVRVAKMVPWWEKSVAAGVNHFLDCLQDKAKPEYGPEAARDTLEIILLAYRAAKEARTLAV